MSESQGAEPTTQQSSQEASSSSIQKSVRVKTDIAWGNCKQIIEKEGNMVLQCLYCQKIIRGGGINRFKYHLAGESGQVGPCNKVSAHIRHQMKESISEVKNKKQKTIQQYKDGHEVIAATSGSAGMSSGNAPNIKNYFVPRTTPGAQPTLRSVLQSKEVIEKCDLAIAKWMVDASVPFNAVNSDYYQPMIDAICSMGGGYKGPNFHQVRGCLLSKCVGEVSQLVDKFRNVWKQTGCTLMADGWTDRCRRTLINFMVYCPKGTVFLKSVDASNASKTAEMLFKLFKEVILYVGAENVVHIVTDNAANYVAAGKLLEAEFPKLYWSPCAAHCINLMLQDFGKFDEVNAIVTHASKVTKYIYNHSYALFLMRQHTCGREILRPAPTRFATNYIALKSILAEKDALRSMVTSKEWTSSAYARDSKGKCFVDQVLDSSFWKQCAEIVKLTEPLVSLLRIVDSENKPAMGLLYQAVYKTRAEMEKRFVRNKRRVQPYLEILDKRWDLQLRKNLHAAGFFLNPAIRFDDNEFQPHETTISGVLNVIERYSQGDVVLLSKLTHEMRMFKDGEGDFGRRSAILDRKNVLPDQWWESYGNDAPNLRKLAIRILSQTCSSSGCERNWSVFEHIHTKKRNRLEHQKLNDLVYVQYNIRLQQRNRLRFQNYDPINLETLYEHFNWVLEESPPYLTTEEVETLRNELANMTIEPISDVIGPMEFDDEDDDAHVQDNVMAEDNQSASVDVGVEGDVDGDRTLANE